MAGCTRPPEEPRPTPGPTRSAPSSLRVGIGEVESLDPAALDGPDAILAAAQVFDGLVAYDAASGAVVPAVAERWEVLDGGRRFVFQLREASFHDGTPVRAQDFVAAWARLVDPQRQRPFAFLLERVEGFARHRLSFGARPFSGVRALDDRSLEVRLTVAWPDFVAVLGHPALSPVPATVDSPEWIRRPVGNGPYRLVEDVGLDSPIRLAAFEGAPRPPRIAALELRPFDSPEAGWPEFLAGELDLAPIPAGLVEEAAVGFGAEGIRPLARLLYCGFNLRDRRLREAALREAVSAALDREALVRSVYGPLALPADGIVPPTLPGYRPGACVGRCGFDADRAVALVREVPRALRTLPLDYSTSDVGDRLAAEVVAQLAAAGLTVQARPHAPEEYARLLADGEQAFFCLTAVADYPRPQALLEPLFTPDSPDNRTGVADGPLSALLERARAEADPIEREELYVDAEQRALRLMPLVPIAWFASRLAVQPYVEGFALDPLGAFDAASLSIRP